MKKYRPVLTSLVINKKFITRLKMFRKKNATVTDIKYTVNLKRTILRADYVSEVFKERRGKK